MANNTTINLPSVLMKSEKLQSDTVPDANPAGAQQPQRLQLVYHTLQPIEVDNMPGIVYHYEFSAEDTIAHYLRIGKPELISRAKFEGMFMHQIDKSKFPTEYKLCWCHEIIHGRRFNRFWANKKKQLHLPAAAWKRFKVEKRLFEYEHSLTEGTSAHTSTTTSVKNRPSSSEGEQLQVWYGEDGIKEGRANLKRGYEELLVGSLDDGTSSSAKKQMVLRWVGMN